MFAVFAPSFVSAQESSTYTVKHGDTLSEIAETHNTTVEKLAENNHIDNIHLIYVGQELVIDGPVAPATPAPTTYAAPAAQDENCFSFSSRNYRSNGRSSSSKRSSSRKTVVSQLQL